MRILVLLSILIISGCTISYSLPKRDLFSEAMLVPDKPDHATLFIYSASKHRSAELSYKHIELDGEHISTISYDTFARLTLAPGIHSIRVTLDGWNPSRFLFKFHDRPSELKSREDTIELDVKAGTTHYLAIERDRKILQYQCKETDEAINICTMQGVGVVLKKREHEVALQELSILHEVCYECD